MAKKKVLAVFAHADDEVLFGWPYLQNPEIERHLIICSRGKAECVQQVCESQGINLVGVLDYDTGFNEILGSCGNIVDAVQRAIDDIKPDFIFTHNGWGEYGHPDHILVSDAIIAYFYMHDIRSADVIAKSTVWQLPSMWFRGNVLGRVQLHTQYFNRGKDIYEAAGQWTTNRYLASAGSQLTRPGLTIRQHVAPHKDLKHTAIWIVETYGWAWFGRAWSMIQRMPQYNHRIIWANHPDQLSDFYLDEDVIFVCHPTMLRGLDDLSNVVPIFASVRSFESEYHSDPAPQELQA